MRKVLITTASLAALAVMPTLSFADVVVEPEVDTWVRLSEAAESRCCKRSIRRAGAESIVILPEMEMMQFLPSHRNAVCIPACPVTVAFRRWKFKGVQKV